MKLPNLNRTKRIIQDTKSRNLSFLLLAFGFLAFYIWLPSATNAQSRLPLSVSPVRHEMIIEPGSTESFAFKFANYSEGPLSGSVKVLDFIVRDSSGTPILLEGENLSSKYAASSWVELPFDRATIESGEILQVPATITAPADASAGGRYVAIFFEPTGTLPTFGGSEKEGASGIIPRVAGLVYIRVAGPITENAQVVRFDVPKFVEYGPIDTSLEILNLGNYHISPTPRLTLTNLLTNTVVDEKILDETNIFPEASRTFEGQVGKKWLFGRYRVDMIAGYGESGQGLLASAFVWAFPWRLALLVILGLIVLALVVLLIAKANTKKQTVLEEKLSEEIKEIEELKEKFKDKISDMPTSQDATKGKK